MPTSLPNGSAGTAYSQTITATGGTPPYLYFKTGGSIPPGLSLAYDTGVVSGTPTTAGPYSFTVTAQDANYCQGRLDYTVTIAPPPPSITTSSPLPAGTTGVAYSQTLAATGGTLPYGNWQVIASTLPAGLSLNLSSGEISGTPTAAGTSTFTVQLTDAASVAASKELSLTVSCPTIALSPTSLSGGTFGTLYSETISASGGTPAYGYAVTSGTLPNGLALAAGGVLSGIPGVVGSSNFTVTATDANSCTVSKAYVVVVSAGGPPCSGTTPTPNSAALMLRIWNDCPTSNLVVTNNYPAKIEISDTQLSCSGWANLHSWSLSEDGSTPAAFQNCSQYSFSADLTLDGDGDGAGGLRISPWWSLNSDGQFMVNAGSGEVACFGGRLPFYSFTSAQGLHYSRGDVIHLGVAYVPYSLTEASPARITYTVTYKGVDYTSGPLAFDQGTVSEDPPHGLWGELTPTYVGGFVQPRVGNGNPVGLTAAWSNIAFTGPPAAPRPTAPATNVSFSAVARTGMTVNWTNGDGASRLVVAKAGSPVTGVPADHVGYIASATFGSGAALAPGEYVVRSGSGNSVPVTGLTPNTTYYFSVFEFNGSSGTAAYLTTSPGTGSRATASAGAYRSVASGNWNAASTWGVSYDGYSTWAAATDWPSSADSVFIQAGHVVTLTGDESCKNLNVNIDAATSLALSNHVLNINGKLRAFSGLLNVIPGTSAACPNVSTWINGGTPSTLAKLKFVGGARPLTLASEWSANPSNPTFDLEFALNDSVTTGTMATSIKARNIIVSTGIIDVNARLAVDGGATNTGNATIAAGATVRSSVTGAGLAPVFSRTSSTNGGTLTMNGKLILTGAAPTVGMAAINLNGTVEYAAAGDQTLLAAANLGASPSTYGTLKTSGTGVKALSQNTIITGAGSLVGGSTTLALGAYALGLPASGGALTVNGTLDLAASKVTTNASQVIIATGATLNRTSGYVVGNLQRAVPVGASTPTFPVGDATNYTPVALSYANVTTGGTVTARTTADTHPNLASSSISTSKYVKRYWTLTSPDVVGTYAATFTFVAGDVQGGAGWNNYSVGDYSGSTWTYPAVGARNATNIQATGLTSYSDFAVGEAALIPTTTALGSSPNPSLFGASVTLTATVSQSAATGTVSFYDGLNLLGSGNLLGGTATLPVTTLAGGSHALTASYGGDATYAGSVSSVVTQDVTQLPTTYTWNGGASGVWTASASWMPNRTSPATNDVIQFSGAATVTSVPTQTIGQLVLSGAYAVTLDGSSAGNTLSISGGSGTDLVVPNLGTLVTGGTNPPQLALQSGTTADLAGLLQVGAALSNNGAMTVGGTLKLGAAFTNGGTVAVNGVCQLENYGTVTGTEFTYGANGSLTFNRYASDVNSGDPTWPATNGPATVSVLYQATNTTPQGPHGTFRGLWINVTRTVNVFNAANYVTLLTPGCLTVNGTCEIDKDPAVAGVPSFGTNAPAYGPSSTLKYNTGPIAGSAVWRASAWSATSGPGYPVNVWITNNTTLDMGHGSTNVARQCSGNLTIDAGSTMTLNGSGTPRAGQMTAPVTVLGNLNLSGTLELSSYTSGDFQLAGNWTRATDGSFVHNGRTVTFNGPGPQTITAPGGETFSRIVMNNGAVIIGAGHKVKIGPGGSITATAPGNLASGADGGLVEFTGDGTATGVVFQDVTLDAGAVDFGTACTVNGVMTMAGGSIANEHPPTYSQPPGPVSTIVFGGGGGVPNALTRTATPTSAQQTEATVTLGGEWLAGTSGAGVPYNVAIATGTTLDFGSATARTARGGVSIASGAGLTLSSSAGGDLAVAGDWTNAGAFTPNGRTVAFNGTALQTIVSGGAPFDGVSLTNPAGLALTGNLTVNGTLAMSGGNMTTGTGNAVVIGPSGTVAYSSGQVVGNLEKPAATGMNVTITYEVGDPGSLTPVTLLFDHVTTAGAITVTSATGDHPALAAAGLDPSHSVNRYWTITNGGMVFDQCAATFGFASGDVDPGANPARFQVGKLDGTTWTHPVVGAHSETSTQATGLTSFSDFVLGEASASLVEMGPPSPAPPILASTDHVTVPFTITRGAGTPALMGFSVVFRVSAPLQLPLSKLSIHKGGFLPGDYSFLPIDKTGGVYQVDGSTMGSPCGTNSLSGTLFSIDLNATHTGSGTVSIESVRLRDCNNDDITPSYGPALTVPADLTVTLTVNVMPAGSGSVGQDPESPSGKYEKGTPVTLTALPPTGWHFVGWAGDLGSTTSPEHLTMTGDKTVTATFAPDQHTLAINVTPVGLGTVGQSPSPGLLGYDYGSVVTITALPSDGCHFVSWTGAASESDNPTTVLMDDNKSVTATFATNPPVTAIGDLAATQIRTVNPVGSTTNIKLTWTATPPGTVVEVWRKGFGHYPEYLDAGGAAPTAPAGHAGLSGAGWTRTAVTEPSGLDLVGDRDFYYFVAFVQDGYGTWSPASPLTAGTLNYFLGDVVGGSGAGDNHVTTADISALGGAYGYTGADVLPVSYLDVGPTSTGWVDGLPSTDDQIEFEDLVMFALNYGQVSGPQTSARPVASAASGSDVLTLERPELVAMGAPVTVTLHMQGSGALLALSTKLAWDPAVVEPVSHEAGEWLTAQNGVAFSAKPGAVDAAVFAAQGMSGEGVLATMTFKVLSAGDPKIRIAALDGRNAGNRKVAVGQAEQLSAAKLPTATQLAFAQPNPFRGEVALAFSLAQRGPVELAIYSVDGRRVRTLVSEAREPGEYRQTWDGRDDGGNLMSAGVYYAYLSAGKSRHTRTVVYLK